MSGDSRRPTKQPVPASAIAGARIQYFQPLAAPFRGDSQRPLRMAPRIGREAGEPVASMRDPPGQSYAVWAALKVAAVAIPRPLSSGPARNDRREMLAMSLAPRSAIQPAPPGRSGPATPKDRQLPNHSTDFSFSQEIVLLLF